MAVTTLTTAMAAAVNYTVVTDTSADFTSVANSTYFYNKADKLVRFKDSAGTVLNAFSSIKTVNSNTLIGSGDVAVQATLVSGTNIKTVNGTSILGSGNIVAGGNRVTQASATSFNQYQAAAGPALTMVFNAMVISTALPVPDSFLGQIIDVDFLARNTSGSSTLIRVYVNSTPTLSGALQLGNYTTNGLIDSMIRFQHRYVVSRFDPTQWNLIGVDSYGISNDFVGPGTLLSPGPFNYASLGNPLSFGAFNPYIIVALNQGGALIAASINY